MYPPGYVERYDLVNPQCVCCQYTLIPQSFCCKKFSAALLLSQLVCCLRYTILNFCIQYLMQIQNIRLERTLYLECSQNILIIPELWYMTIAFFYHQHQLQSTIDHRPSTIDNRPSSIDHQFKKTYQQWKTV